MPPTVPGSVTDLTARPYDMMAMSLRLLAAVNKYAQRAQAFFYIIMLTPYACPICNGELAMVREGRCRCTRCGESFDPTIAFQRCPSCDGAPRIRVRRYECRRCGGEIVSRFLFHGLVFDADYFRQKVAEHQQRKAEQAERVRNMLAENRSEPILPPAADIAGMSDLLSVLNSLTTTPIPSTRLSPSIRFDLDRYENHVKAHLGPIPIPFEDIPALDPNPRLDRIWRFIAIIFMAHAGMADIHQSGTTIKVNTRETHAKRQTLSGIAEAVHGLA